jgi:chromate transporter
LNKLTENKHFKNFIRGVKPVVTALILSTGLLLLVECIGINIDVKEFDVNLVSIIVFGIVAVLYYIVLKVFKKKISSIQIILLAAVLGIGLSYLLA